MQGYLIAIAMPPIAKIMLFGEDFRKLMNFPVFSFLHSSSMFGEADCK